jgi:hypothetical protein
MILFRNTNDNEETYFSEKELKARKAYHIVIRSIIEEITGLHKVSLFINGYDDIRTSIGFYRPFENTQILVG